jgi:hypothetical protein
MTEKRKKTLMNRVAFLKKNRNVACQYGDVNMQQVINYEIADIAKKLKIDYYQIA